MDNQNTPNKNQEMPESLNEETQGSNQQPAIDWQEQYLRIAADFQNYKKRTEREKEQWINVMRADVLRKLLGIADDFDRALKQPIDTDSSTAGFLEGFTIIRKSLEKYLESYGVTAMTEYTVFNPEFHEAIAHVPSSSHEAGHIVDVVEKGYLMNNTVLRPARVTVAQEHA